MKADASFLLFSYNSRSSILFTSSVGLFWVMSLLLKRIIACTNRRFSTDVNSITRRFLVFMNISHTSYASRIRETKQLGNSVDIKVILGNSVRLRILLQTLVVGALRRPLMKRIGTEIFRGFNRPIWQKEKSLEWSQESTFQRRDWMAPLRNLYRKTLLPLWPV